MNVDPRDGMPNKASKATPGLYDAAMRHTLFVIQHEFDIRHGVREATEFAASQFSDPIHQAIFIDLFG